VRLPRPGRLSRRSLSAGLLRTTRRRGCARPRSLDRPRGRKQAVIDVDDGSQPAAGLGALLGAGRTAELFASTVATA